MQLPFTSQEDDKPGQGPSLAKLDSIIQRERDKRSRYEREWREALSFFEGDHYVAWNRHTQRLDPLPRDANPGRVRLRHSYLEKCIVGVLAKLTKQNATFEGVPGTDSIAAYRASKLAEIVFQYLWEELDLARKDEEAILWSLLCGHAFAEVYWDADAGERMEVYLYPALDMNGQENPEAGQPIMDPGEVDAYRMMSAANGWELETSTLTLGEIGVEVLSPFELFLIGGRTPREARAAIKVKGYDPHYVQEKWGVEVAANALAEQAVPARQGTGEKNLVMVYQYYARPSKKHPEGQYIAWTKGQLLQRSEFPYSDHRLPFARYGSVQVPGRDYDLALAHQLMPLQKELNRTRSQIVEYKNHTVRPQMVATAGQLQKKVTDEPGSVILVRPMPGAPLPSWRQMPALPAYVFEHVGQILQAMDQISGLNETSQGSAPPNVEGAYAIAQLQEESDGQLGPRVRSHERALCELGTLVLSRAKEFYIEQRLVRIRGAAGAFDSRLFSSEDLDGCEDIRVVAGTTAPRNLAAERLMIAQLMDKGAISPEVALPLLQIGSMRELTSDYVADANKQQREIQSALRGEPIQAAIYDGHSEHLRILTRFMKSPEFEDLPEAVKSELVQHWAEHRQMMMQMAPPRLPDGMRVNYQIRSEGSPTEDATVLRGTGFNVDPAQLMQERLQEVQARASSDALASVQAEKPADPVKTATDQATAQTKLMHAQTQLAGAHADHANAQAQAASSLAQAHMAQAHSADAFTQAHIAQAAADGAQILASSGGHIDLSDPRVIAALLSGPAPMTDQ